MKATILMLCLVTSAAWAGDNFGLCPKSTDLHCYIAQANAAQRAKFDRLRTLQERVGDQSYILMFTARDQTHELQRMFLQWPMTDCEKDVISFQWDYAHEGPCFAATPPVNLVHMEFMDNRGRRWRAKWEEVK